MQLIPPRPTLASQAARVLREQLIIGIWKNHLPSERTLSARLGVSRPTVRAALELLRREGWIEVSQGRATRILQSAGTPASPVSNVALLTPVPLRELPPSVLYWVDELRDKLAADGGQLDVHVSRPCFGARPVKALESLTRHSPAAAWVVYLSTEAMQRWFQAQGLPCLVAGSCVPGVKLPSVDVDYRAVCRHAAGWLLAHQRRRIALVLPDVGHIGDLESEQGFLEAFAGKDEMKASPLVLRHDGTREGIVKVLKSVMRGPSKADGLVVARSAHVVTVITCLQHSGVRLPEEVAVISRDSDPFLEFITPAVTRYASNPAQFAKRISQAAMQLAKSGTFPARAIRLMPQWVKGETV
ncbi:MAG: hypothetical protein RL693_2093 [Verrucomicrobiota bacterium]